MAKMTQEMYGAEGRVGNKTYYRSNGKTVAREIVTPKNPKTQLQTLQRVISKQVSESYKKFKAIADHSFENVTNGAACMNRFKQLNMRAIRSRCAELLQAGISLSQYYNFQPVGAINWVPGATILSQGQLQAIQPTIEQDQLGLYVAKLTLAENTYAGVCAATGAKRGDQLTFVTVEKVGSDYQVKLARVILDPRNTDGSGASMTDTAFIAEGAINKPNWKNQGVFTALSYDGGMEFCLGPNGSTLVAVAIIASRKDGDKWLRSNSQLVLSEAAIGTDLCSMGDAINHSYAAEEIDLESDYYLNNAGTGGGQGTTQGDATPSTDPVYNSNVMLNGVSQNISGGSVNVTAPLSTIGIQGQNLATAPVKAKKVGTDVEILPSAQSATLISFTNLNIAATESIQVLRNNVVWFTVNAITGGGGGNNGDAD